jgi:hypothetical protein
VTIERHCQENLAFPQISKVRLSPPIVTTDRSRSDEHCSREHYEELAVSRFLGMLAMGVLAICGQRAMGAEGANPGAMPRTGAPVAGQGTPLGAAANHAYHNTYNVNQFAPAAPWSTSRGIPNTAPSRASGAIPSYPTTAQPLPGRPQAYPQATPGNATPTANPRSGPWYTADRRGSATGSNVPTEMPVIDFSDASSSQPQYGPPTAPQQNWQSGAVVGGGLPSSHAPAANQASNGYGASNPMAGQTLEARPQYPSTSASAHSMNPRAPLSGYGGHPGVAPAAPSRYQVEAERQTRSKWAWLDPLNLFGSREDTSAGRPQSRSQAMPPLSQTAPPRVAPHYAPYGSQATASPPNAPRTAARPQRPTLVDSLRKAWPF